MNNNPENKIRVESLLAGAAFKEDGSVSVLTIGQWSKTGTKVDIVNALQGMEANELWRRLNTLASKEE